MKTKDIEDTLGALYQEIYFESCYSVKEKVYRVTVFFCYIKISHISRFLRDRIFTKKNPHTLE